MKKPYKNLYSISFYINDIDYGQYLKAVKISKDITKGGFVEDVYVFEDERVELLNYMLVKCRVEISLNRSNSYIKLYEAEGIISKVEMVENNIYVFFESNEKINWVRKNGGSYVLEHTNLASAIGKYIKTIDKYFHHKNDTKYFINYEKNINKFQYENILFPISTSCFRSLASVAQNLYIINAPFYIFLDDYSFDKNTTVEIGFYDLTDIKSLRAVLLDDLNTTNKPILQESGDYYTSSIYFKYEKSQKFINTVYGFSSLKPESTFEYTNKFAYINSPDTIENAKIRHEKTKEFFSRAAKYYRYSIRDIDVSKLRLGYRFVNRSDDTKIQYAQAVVSVELNFNAFGKQDVLENKGAVANQFGVTAEIITITN